MDRPEFPPGLENLEIWEGIFQSGKSQVILNRLKKSGKIKQNTGKFKRISDKCYLLSLLIYKLTEYYLLKWIKLLVSKTKHLKNTGKWKKKTLEKSGNFVGPEKWEP